MRITYKLTEQNLCSCEDDEYTGYGISAVTGDGVCIAAVDDLSLDRDAVLSLVGLCNQLELDPIHLLDVAEDFLV